MKTKYILLASYLGVGLYATNSVAQIAPPEPAPLTAPPVTGLNSTAPAADAVVPMQMPAPIEPPPGLPPGPVADTIEAQPIAPPDSIEPPPTAPGVAGEPGMVGTGPAEFTPGATTGGALDFQGDEVGTVLRLLARQAGVNLFVSDQVTGTLTMRIEGKSPLEAIRFICRARGLELQEEGRDFFVKTQAEKSAEPLTPGDFTFAYANAGAVAPLLQAKIGVGGAPQVDSRTNTLWYQVPLSRQAEIQAFLDSIDSPTKQVMIETRLIEVTAEPSQTYGINWAGALLNQEIGLRGSSVVSTETTARGDSLGSAFGQFNRAPGVAPGGNSIELVDEGLPTFEIGGEGIPTADGGTQLGPFSSLGGANSLINSTTDTLGVTSNGSEFLLDPSNLFSTLAGQYAILSAPALSVTLSLLNQDADAEFLAHPRVVTANNMPATIKITRNQPVPQLNFNEQTATAVFGGFEDKEFGNTLTVLPTINKDRYVTLSVKPQISNKVGDAIFSFAGAEVASPIIDNRQLESNVLIRSGDTLAIGGLLQDETIKASSKVPLFGDIPVLGYLFQEKSNTRRKRNLLVFVTPTIIDQGYGTGLEDQVNGLVDSSGEEYANPNGWRNNAQGAMRILPTSKRQISSTYPVPGQPERPRKVGFKGAPSPRE